MILASESKYYAGLIDKRIKISHTKNYTREVSQQQECRKNYWNEQNVWSIYWTRKITKKH